MLSPPIKRLLENVPFVLPALLLLPESGYVAIFDGRAYADCIVAMATQPSLEHMGCANHPSHAYVLVTAAVQALRPTSSVPMVLSHLGLLLASLWALRRILQHLFPSPEAWGERALVVGMVAVNPVVLASTLQPNPDLAVMAGALLLTEALLAKRMFRACLAGFFLLFTKEIGILFLPVIVTLYAGVFVTRGEGSMREKVRGLLRLWPAVLPLIATAARLLVLRYASGNAFVAPPSRSGDTSSILAEFLSVRLLDRVFLSYAAGIGVLQFQWLSSLVLLALLVVMGARWFFGKPALAGVDLPKSIAFALVLFAALAYLTTRYRTYSSPRYWLVVYPAMALATYAAATALRMPRAARMGFFAAVCALSLGSTFHPIDPVSRAVYGTFSFGEHTMLRIGSITDYKLDRATGSRDALPYNLQFANIHHLQNAVISSLNPQVPHLVDIQTEWHLWDKVDRSLRRTLDPKGFDLPALRAQGSGQEFQLFEGVGGPQASGPPREINYVVYPMFEELQQGVLRDMSRLYNVASKETVSHDGYTAQVYRLQFDEARWRAQRRAQDEERLSP